MADVATSVASAFDQAWDRFVGRLDGMGDEEYFWEPVEGCWSVRRADDGRWTIDGGGGGASARAFLDRAYHGYWRDKIAALSQQQWWEPIGASFGSYKDLCTTDLALHVLDELTHHAAEIGVLRDLYRQQDSPGNQPRR
jgi:hypothetical protein